MQLEYIALSDMGRLRNNNEDSVLAVPEHGLVVLADGMGGHNAGEVASRMAVNLIAQQLGEWLPGNSGASMRDLRRAMAVSVDAANRSIFEAANTNADYHGMGTTLVVAVVHQGEMVLGHAGDSRAYLWRGGTLKQLTRDHSLLQEQIDSGLLTLAEAAMSGNGNLVTRALGVEDIVLLDVQHRPIEDGDLYLLCSDGLTDMLDDEEIAEALADSVASDTETRAQRLIDLANGHGGRDNISVALIHASEKNDDGLAQLR